MIEVKDLLSRWSGILLGEESKIESIKNAVFETLGVQIKKEDIKIRNNTVFLNVKSIYKSEIFLKKDEILRKLEKTFGKRTPEDVR